MAGTAFGAGLLASGLLLLAGSPAVAVNTQGQVDLLRPESGTTIRSLSTAYDGGGDSLIATDMTNDGFDEIIVANAGGGSENGRVDVLDAFNVTISTFDTAYDDDGDAIAGGDVTNDGADELIVANAGGSSENGRIDVLNLFGFTISSFNTAYDDSGDSVVVGDVSGDGAEDIIVVNDEGGGRMDVHDLFGVKFASFGNTGYDDDDSVDVGDVTGDGRAEIVVANTEANGRVDVYGGTGGLLRRFSSTVTNPKVMVAEMSGDNRADIALVRDFVSGSTGQTETLRLFSSDGAQIRSVATSFTPGSNAVTRGPDGIALGNVNAGPLAEIIVANV